jgi:hypothetical protein
MRPIAQPIRRQLGRAANTAAATDSAWSADAARTAGPTNATNTTDAANTAAATDSAWSADAARTAGPTNAANTTDAARTTGPPDTAYATDATRTAGPTSAAYTADTARTAGPPDATYATDVRVAIEAVVMIDIDVIVSPTAAPTPTAAPKCAHHDAETERDRRARGVVTPRRIRDGRIGICRSAVHGLRVIGRDVDNLGIGRLNHNDTLVIHHLSLYRLLWRRLQSALVLRLFAHALHGVHNSALLRQESVAQVCASVLGKNSPLALA